MLFGLLLVSLGILADARFLDWFKKAENGVCNTDECKVFARQIVTSMNDSVDPCVDFYEYACGNWPKNNPIPRGKNTWKVVIAAAHEKKQKVEDMLKSESKSDEIPPVKIAKKWYKACMDTDGIERRGLQPLISILSGIGGRPLLEKQWDQSKHNWQVVDDYYTAVRGSYSLHDVRVAVYGANATALAIVLDAPYLPPATWLLSSEIEEENPEENSEETNEEIIASTKKIKKDGEYWKFITKVMSSLKKAANSKTPDNEIQKDLEDVLNFQWKLGKINLIMGDYVNMTIKDFQKWYNNLNLRTDNSKVNWSNKVINVFKDVKINIDDNTMIKVTSPEYFKNLALLLDQTPARTISNYIHWNFISNTISKTTKEMSDLIEKINAGGIVDDDDDKEEVRRSDFCLGEARMTDIVAYEYIRKYFSKKTIKMAVNAMDDTEKEMETLIENSNWADKTIKNLALRKLRTLKKNIAYPEWYDNPKIMNNLLNGLDMGTTYFENSLNLKKFYTLKDLRTLKHEEEAKPWIVDPLTINAFYLNEDNSITLPAANLERPFFSEAQPNTMNYALTGYLMAHEMNHGFDYQRHIYDESGKEFEWPAAMKTEYLKRVQCFVDQFDSYTLDGTPNGPKIEKYGNQTVEENMSDTMGLQAVFKAYKRREKMNGKPDAVLPGLESFNNDQVFFLTFANLWCENMNPEYLEVLPRFDMHSTGRLRVTGTLSNNNDFAATFKCPLGSPMNPEKKCNIWRRYDIRDLLWWARWETYSVYQV